MEQILAGTITAAQIDAIPCCQLSLAEKEALFNALADKVAADGATSAVLTEFKGEQEGGTLSVPAFFSGYIKVIDVDNTKQIDHSGATQFVTDDDTDVFVEDGGVVTWQHIAGRHYKARTFTLASGVRVAYLFSLV